MFLYQRFYEKCFFQFFEGMMKKRKTARIYSQALKSQWLTRSELCERQLMEVKKLLEFAQQYSSYYSRSFLGCGFNAQQMTSLSDLQRLPILTKDGINKNFDQLVTEPFRETCWTKSTGGSTGQPLHFAYTKESYEWRTAMSKRGYSWCGAAPGTKQAYIWGVGLGPQNKLSRLKEKVHHFIDRQIYFNCFDFGEEQMAAAYKHLNKFKPGAIIGYTNPLYAFARYVQDQGGLSFKPSGVISAAEKLHPFQREAIEKAFGAPAFNTYGSREFMLMASECEKHEGMHLSMENLLVEIIKEDGTPAKSGEIGRVIVTDLHNYGMPFIRYEIGDLAVASDRQCSCGRGLALIDDVVGRTLDMIKTPDGRSIPGEFFPHLIKDFPEIERFQVVQHRIDLLTVKYVPKSESVGDAIKHIDAEIRKITGGGIEITYQEMTDIPLTKTGKYRVTISELEHQR